MFSTIALVYTKFCNTFSIYFAKIMIRLGTFVFIYVTMKRRSFRVKMMGPTFMIFKWTVPGQNVYLDSSGCKK
jgi:hypothetical protein